MRRDATGHRDARSAGGRQGTRRLDPAELFLVRTDLRGAALLFSFCRFASEMRLDRSRPTAAIAVTRVRRRRFKYSRGFVNPEKPSRLVARAIKTHATVRAACISRGESRVQPNGVSGSGCRPARSPPAIMATPPVTVKEVVSVRARALARRTNPRSAIFRSGISGCLLGAPNPSTPPSRPIRSSRAPASTRNASLSPISRWRARSSSACARRVCRTAWSSSIWPTRCSR